MQSAASVGVVVDADATLERAMHEATAAGQWDLAERLMGELEARRQERDARPPAPVLPLAGRGRRGKP